MCIHTHTRTHARTHARTHTYTQARQREILYSKKEKKNEGDPIISGCGELVACTDLLTSFLFFVFLFLSFLIT